MIDENMIEAIESEESVMLAQSRRANGNEATTPTPCVGDEKDKKHIKRFDGKPGGPPVDEFLLRFENLAKMKGWSVKQKAENLVDMTTEKAFSLLSSIHVFDTEDPYEKLKDELRNAYGVSMEKAIVTLIERKFRRDESIYDFASDLRNLVATCLPSLSLQDRSKVAALHFWRGIHQSETVRNLFGSWKVTERSLEKAIALAGDTAEPMGQNAFLGHSKGKGKAKGYGNSNGFRPNYYNANKYIANKPIQKDYKSYHIPRKCYKCGGIGHESRDCATKSVCQNAIVTVIDGIKCLLDTGCSISMLFIGEVKPEEKLVSYMMNITAFGSQQIIHEAILEKRIESVVLVTVPVFRFPIDIEGNLIGMVIGMDFIRIVGGVRIWFDEMNYPNWQRLTEVHVLTIQSKSESLTKVGTTVATQTEEIDESLEGEPSEVNAKMVYEDMIIRRKRNLADTEKIFSWSVEWCWKDDTRPRSKGPAIYNFDKYSEQAQKGFRDELELWISNEFLVPICHTKVKNVIPFICLQQEHKKSTPIRPVGDYKKALNQYIKSAPNEDVQYPVSCMHTLLRWRATNVPLADMVLVDISKAYMRMYVQPELVAYQGFYLPWKKQYYSLTRVGFGLSIAVKALRVIIQYIMAEEGIDPNVLLPFVDDILCPKDMVDMVRKALDKNGFPTKEPENADAARILGLQLKPNGDWERREKFPECPAELTRRSIHSWCAKITAHYPVCGWLRPATSQLKRLSTGDKANWDEIVSPEIKLVVEQFKKEVTARGDSVGSKFSFNIDETWTLYTDASKYAYGCVLKIGGTTVLDATWLRQINDDRAINLAELDAVVKGLGLLYQVTKTFNTKTLVNVQVKTRDIKLKCDNTNTIAWLNRQQASHWKAAKGDSAAIIDSKLNKIADIVNAAHIRLQVEYVASEDNISDVLSRVPLYMIKQKSKSTCMTVQIPRINTEVTRNSEGVVQLVNNDARIDYILQQLHEHEGANALFERARRVIMTPGLRQLCRDFVSRCPNCQLSKVTTNAEVQVAPDTSEIPLHADMPWRSVHMDVIGPYRSDEITPTNFAITLIDRCTGYLLIKGCRYSPIATQFHSLFRRVSNVFNAIPETCMTDNGSICISAEFVAALQSCHCRVLRSPVGAHWSNGKVERAHRIIREHLIANNVSQTATFVEFESQLQRIAQNYNTAHSNRQRCSPHELIFGYPAWIHPRMPLHWRPNRPEETKWESKLSMKHNHSTGNAQVHAKHALLPKVGEIWLLRRAAIGERNLHKLTRPFRAARIVACISSRVYRVILAGGKQKTVHLRHLKKVSPELEKTLDTNDVPPSLGEGGMSQANRN